MQSVMDIRHFSTGIVQPFIFISYSHDDDAVVEKIAKRLRREGYCIWVDYENIRGGYFADEIKNGIRECSVFLQCISRSYIQKPYCEKEARMADDENKNTIVIAIDDVQKEENPNAFPFGHHIYGYGMGFSVNFDSHWEVFSKDYLLNRLRGEKTDRVQYVFAGEQVLGRLRYHCDNTYRNSGNYVLSEIHKELFPDIFDEEEQAFYHAESTMEVSLLAFLRREMAAKQVLLKGAGGTGKTVSMLQACKALLGEGRCAVYVPLNKVHFEHQEDPIKHYIRKQIFGEDDTLYRVFVAMANTEIEGNVFLFLDGVNELPIARRSELIAFLDNAKTSPEWIGVRFVLSSRNEMEHYNIKTLDMLPLEGERIKDFLDKLQVEIPQNEKVLELIRNPLMLGLYADASRYAELYHKKGGRFKIRLEAEPDNAAKIIGNYLQTQLFQMASVTNSDSDFILYHVLIDYALPAIAAEMMSREDYLRESDVRSILKSALDEENEHFRWYSTEILEGLWWDYGVGEENITRRDIKAIHDFAIRQYRFLYLNRNNDEEDEEASVEFLHQEFRDYFAGAYYANEIRMLARGSKYIEGDYAAETYLGKAMASQDCLEYAAAILKEKEARPRKTEQGYEFPGKRGRMASSRSLTEKALQTLRHREEKTDPGSSTLVANLMQILVIGRNKNLAQCDFSYLDLTGCRMNGVRFSCFYQDKNYNSCFDGAIINEDFLLNPGHSETVLAVCEGKDGWVYSADEDGWIFGWNYVKGEVTRIRKYNDIPKEMVYDRGSDSLCVAFDNRIVLLDAASHREKYVRYNENGFQYFRYVRFDEQGDVKYACDLEPFRWYDLKTNLEEERSISHELLSGCVRECPKTGRIIYTMYGRSVYVRDLLQDSDDTGNHTKVRWLGMDAENTKKNNKQRINTINVNEAEDRLLAATGQDILEYMLTEENELQEPIWKSRMNANINDAKYMREGGYLLAAGKVVIILDGKGRILHTLHPQNIEVIRQKATACYDNHENSLQEEQRKYYIVSNNGTIKELDEKLNVTRMRSVGASSIFSWVKDRRNGEIQMLFGPNSLYPNGFRYSFERGEAIPAGWCYEMKMARVYEDRSDYLVASNKIMLSYDRSEEKNSFTYVNYSGIWIFGCSFRKIRGELSSAEGREFLHMNGGMTDEL